MNEYKVPKLNQWEMNNNELYLEKGYNKAIQDVLQILKKHKKDNVISSEQLTLINLIFEISVLNYNE